MSTEISRQNNHRSLFGVRKFLESFDDLSTGQLSETKLKLGNIEITLSKPGTTKATQKLETGVFDFVRFYHPVFTNMTDTPKSKLFNLSEHRVLLLINGSLGEYKPPNHWIVLNVLSESDPFILNVSYPTDSKKCSLLDALESFDEQPEIILFVVDGQQYGHDALLSNQLEHAQSLLNCLFSTCKHYYSEIQDEKIRVVSVVNQAWDHHNELNPVTGLFGGFIKSLHRDLPNAYLAAVNTDETLSEAIAHVGNSLGQHPNEDELTEIFVRNGREQKQCLALTETLTQQQAIPQISSDTVVLATGGARGVTAVLLEELIRRYHCKVVAFGRTDLSLTPKHFLEMPEQELAAYETQFYRAELADNKTRNIIDLKRIFQRHLAANEIYQNQLRMAKLGGSFEYVCADITHSDTIENAIVTLIKKYGNIDMLVHGAGTQISRALTNKTVADFNSVVSAKLIGLRNIYQALQHNQNTDGVIFHILTSAFSFWGNDGQPDYGAANEAMNRLADAFNTTGAGNWSSLAWLGWAGIGMTRGSEYAMLAEQRDLYPVTKEEGQELFSALMEFRPKQSINILATAKEIRYYHVPIHTHQESEIIESISKVNLSLDKAPYLKNHLVAGMPTAPGAVELIHCVLATLHLLPGAQTIQINNAQFISFLKSYPNQLNEMRIITKRVDNESDMRVKVKAKVESDFIHSSGRVLRKGIRNFQAEIELKLEAKSEDLAPEILEVRDADPGFLIMDPYIHGKGMVALSGVFDCLREITVNEYGQVARLQLPLQLRGDSNKRLLAPAVLLDALWRLAVMRPQEHRIPLYVPIESRSIQLYMGFSEQENFEQFLGAQLFATKPEPMEGNDGAVQIKYAVAVGSDGKILAINQGIIAQINN